MSSPPSGPAPSKPVRRERADARRNRESLLGVARDAFAAGDVVLEDIARRAGVGIGTLYRHFPTREALVEAVYAAELDDVASSPASLLDEMSPDAALRAWMDRYAKFVATKRGMYDTLRTGWAAGSIATPATRERLAAAVATILSEGARAGSLREDVEPHHVTSLLLGVFLSTNTADTVDQTDRLLDLVLDALRPQARSSRRSDRVE